MEERQNESQLKAKAYAISKQKQNEKESIIADYIVIGVIIMIFIIIPLSYAMLKQ
jgi:hypothetical protein